MATEMKLAANTGSSLTVEKCQICGHPHLDSILFVGYIPPVNQMHPIDQRPREQPAYPAELMFCSNCKLVQLGCIVDPAILFPPDYPYTSGTTRILHENFAEMVRDCKENVVDLGADALVLDVGSNDGTLLSKWRDAGHRVHGIEPTDKAQMAVHAGIPSTQAFFTVDSAADVKRRIGQARVITATNVFAHIERVHDVVEAILMLLEDDGIFISESHYLLRLLETCQYDTIYHEHLRYYSVHSLRYLLEAHGLEIIRVKEIPSHGGSVRVYAARRGTRPVQACVAELLAQEKQQGVDDSERLSKFAQKVVMSKLNLYAVLKEIKARGERVYGVGAPSRASTLIVYTGLDRGILDCVLEIAGSHKIGRYMPGTLIPVREESSLFTEQPEYAMLLSWHIADELIPKLRKRGYRGKFIVPLPEPRVVE